MSGPSYCTPCNRHIPNSTVPCACTCCSAEYPSPLYTRLKTTNRIGNLDLAGRSAHATALLNNHPQAAMLLESAAGELEFRHPKEFTVSSRRRPWSGAGAGKGGQPPRATNASPKLRSAQGSGSGSGAWSGSGSGTPCRPSPISSAGMDSGGSLVESEDLSYEYVESDREE